MGRKSKAQRIIDDHREIEDVFPDSRYLVLYDFKEGRNPSAFYSNLHLLFGHYEGKLVQRSVAEVVGSRASEAVASLAGGYGAKVLRYRIEEQE